MNQDVTSGLPFPRNELLVGPKWIGETSAGWLDHTNPATGKVQRTFPIAGPGEIHQAVVAARQALPMWRAWPADQRRDLLLRIGALLKEHAAELSMLATIENGMPLLTSMMVNALGTEYFHYYAGWTEKLQGEVVPTYPGNSLDYTRLEPFGVIAVIIPWNGPLAFIGLKVAPALAAGNCVVLKPSELAPFTSLRFAELCQQAGLPPGVLSVVPGGPDAGDALVRHPEVGKVSFTGGIPTARKVMAAAADNLTPVVLELGGKSANIVFADADLSAAVPMSAWAGTVMGSGQGCFLPTRLLVEDAIYSEVEERVVEFAANVVVGDPLDSATQMGPVVSADSCNRIQSVIEEAVSVRSGRLLTGGKRLEGELADGYFLPPTVFGDVDNSSALARHEIFGPVLSLVRFTDERHAIALANDSIYGLAGYVWTNDMKRGHRVAAQLEAGTVGINGMIALSPSAPFGGTKASGFGREGGRAGIIELMQTKNICVQLD